MKTKRKTVKTPAKGRRSSIVCVRKSPIVRRNPRRTVRNLPKTPKLATYESPLVHLYNNSGVSSTSTVNSKIINENRETKEDEESKGIQNSPSTSKSPMEIELKANNSVIKNEIIVNETEQCNKDMDVNYTEIPALPKSKKRSLISRIGAGEIPKAKKRKLKKNPLSKINETNELNKLSNTVILVDDSEFVPKTETVHNTTHTDSIKNISIDKLVDNCLLNQLTSEIPVCKPTNNVLNESRENISNSEYVKSTLSSEPSTSSTIKNSILTETAKNTEDVVVIDCNDSFMEMEAYHEAFKSGNSSSNTNFLDSVIVIDPDDDPPVQTDASPKPSEDCFVVWSSLPKPCTSNNELNTEPSISSKQSWVNDNLELLKCDKILIDTKPSTINLKSLNNENNKPKKQAVKTPKVNSRKILSKSAKIAKTTTKAGAKKATTTPTKTATARKRTKNIGELIFLSESRVDDKSTEKTKSKKGTLREIVIDGSNVAMAYTNNKMFSEKGIKMLIDYFTKKGHTVKVFVPQYRRSRNFPLLEKWHSEGIVVFTPSRKLGNKCITSYDDRYILEYATACGGIVVSQDQFRDLYAEKPQYRDTIENRLLVPTFVGDYVMFPEDPLGRNGPTLAKFLKH